MSEDQIIYGLHAVEEALSAGNPGDATLFMAKGKRSRAHSRIFALAKAAGLRPKEVPPQKLAQLTEGGKHQGVVLQRAAVQSLDLDELLKNVADQEVVRLLLLDQIQDAHNLGALLRSAAAFGVSGVIRTRDRSAPLDGAAIKASAGQALKLPIATVTNLSRALEQLKEAGYWVYGAAGEAKSTPIAKVEWAEKSALVVGAEGKGLRRLTRQHCDLLVKIPMSPGVESLNVSVAGALILYEIARG